MNKNKLKQKYEKIKELSETMKRDHISENAAQCAYYTILSFIPKEDSELKIGIISDIHGNLEALEAVLENFKQNGIEKIICLGDLIGRSHKIRRSSTKNHENAR